MFSTLLVLVLATFIQSTLSHTHEMEHVLSRSAFIAWLSVSGTEPLSNHQIQD